MVDTSEARLIDRQHVTAVLEIRLLFSTKKYNAAVSMILLYAIIFLCEQKDAVVLVEMQTNKNCLFSFFPCFPSLNMASWQPPFHWDHSWWGFGELKGQMHLSDTVSGLFWIFSFFFTALTFRHFSSAVDIFSHGTYFVASFIIPCRDTQSSLGITLLLQKYQWSCFYFYLYLVSCRFG